MGEIRRHRALIAWVAIVVLLGNVVAGFSASSSARNGAADYPVDLLGPMIICSEHGPQTLPASDGGKPQAPGEHCPACLAATALAFVLAIVVASLLAPLSTRQPFALNHRTIFAARLRRAGLAIRAPPLPA